MISELGLTFTLTDCDPRVSMWFISLVVSVKTFQVGRDNPSND